VKNGRRKERKSERKRKIERKNGKVEGKLIESKKGGQGKRGTVPSMMSQ
jgi:hypothetical protein